MKIVFAGGGSGGHILPIIAIIREIRKLSPKEEIDFYYIGPKDNFVSLLLSQEDIKIKSTTSGKIRRYNDKKSIFLNFIDLAFKIPFGILQSFFHLFFLAPDLIFSKGGFGSIPTVLAGWLLQVPIFIHESDSIPGLSNKFSAKFAKKVFVSFPRTTDFKEEKMILVGNPIRRELLEGSKEEAKEIFDLTGRRPTILVLGGSQGATRMNDVILEILSKLVREFEIIHQCGEKNFKKVNRESKILMKDFLHKYYHPFGFLKEHQLKNAYAACDIIISRAGSGSIFEIAATGKPSILVPLPESAQNHQVNNAYLYAETGASIVLEAANFTPYFFFEKLKNLFDNPDTLQQMSDNAKSFARPLAAKKIATYLLTYLNLIIVKNE
jgi:UDP-N-acetylglucosamine--N-acetylmuramyl-(pentapeptide) pyrophosphoryl-undecaprenol N-acetylglucosamine transferase